MCCALCECGKKLQMRLSACIACCQQKVATEWFVRVYRIAQGNFKMCACTHMYNTRTNAGMLVARSQAEVRNASIALVIVCLFFFYCCVLSLVHFQLDIFKAIMISRHRIRAIIP